MEGHDLSSAASTVQGPVTCRVSSRVPWQRDSKELPRLRLPARRTQTGCRIGRKETGTSTSGGRSSVQLDPAVSSGERYRTGIACIQFPSFLLLPSAPLSRSPRGRNSHLRCPPPRDYFLLALLLNFAPKPTNSEPDKVGVAGSGTATDGALAAQPVAQVSNVLVLPTQVEPSAKMCEATS